MSRPKQLLLGTVAPAVTAAEARFRAETIRRGGPYEVQGKRWRAEANYRRLARRYLDSPGEISTIGAGILKQMPKTKRREA